MVAKAKDSQYNLNCWMSLTIIGQYIKEKKKKSIIRKLEERWLPGATGQG